MPYIEVATVVLCSIVAGYYVGLAPDEPEGSSEASRQAPRRDPPELQ
jgi:hypothetical protein